MIKCPDDDSLKRLLDEPEESRETAAVVEHVETCTTCQLRLDELTQEAPLRRPPANEPERPRQEFLDRVRDVPAALFDAVDSVRTSYGGEDLDLRPEAPGFVVEEEIGRGGMGVVFRARQLGLGRSVALKVLKGSADADDLARFRTEAESVARLHHPNIVEIYQVGEWRSPGGASLPYFVQEFVAGGSLADALKGRPAPPRTAAKLTALLARGIQHAHERGVVHRDLKPSNILLAGDRPAEEALVDPKAAARFIETAVPKIADFGLAKRLDLGEAHTRTGAVLGTPSYMAPEQCGGEIREIGPRTDVYGLGALLYEMLTGRPPFQAADVIQTVLLVLHEEPVPPRRLQPQSPLDLETICLKCLEKEPSRRYASAAALADDVERFLANSPIAARPIGPLGRTRKWARRRPALAGSLAALTAVVAGSLGGLSYLYSRAEGERKTAVQERVRADDARADVKAMNEFLVKNILAAARPAGAGQGSDATLRSVLDAALPRIEDAFRGRPLVEANIRDALGITYYQLGEYKTARDLIARGREMRSAAAGAEHPETLSSENNLAQVLLRLGDLAGAEPLLRHVREARAAAIGPEAPEALLARHNFAGHLLKQGKLAEAEAEFRAVFEAYRRTLGADHDDTLKTQEVLASVLGAKGEYDESERLARSAAASRERLFGPNHADTLSAKLGLAGRLAARRKFADAAQLMEEVATADRRIFGADHSMTLVAENNLAVVYQEMGRHAAAAPLHQHCYDVRCKTAGPEAEETLVSEQNLAMILHDLHQPAEAERHLKNIVAVRRRRQSSRPADLATALATLGWHQLESGQSAAAEPLLREALALREQFLPPDHWRTLYVRGLLGDSRAARREFQSAEPLLRDSFVKLRSSREAPRTLVVETRDKLVRLYERWGKAEEAAKWREERL